MENLDIWYIVDAIKKFQENPECNLFKRHVKLALEKMKDLDHETRKVLSIEFSKRNLSLKNLKVD